MCTPANKLLTQNKQGSIVVGVLSEASAAAKIGMKAMDLNLPAYSTYMQSSTWDLLYILRYHYMKKVLLIIRAVELMR